MPVSGPAGTLVTISGTNFGSTPVDNVVFFGAVRASVVAASVTSLTVAVPVGATYHPIAVTVNGLTGFSVKPFVVTFPNGALTPHSYAAVDPLVDTTMESKVANLTSADFDGDGKIDIAAIDQKNLQVCVFRNKSTRSSFGFDAKQNYATGNEPVSVASGDLDGDGKPDIAVANMNSNTVSVYRNTSSPGILSFAEKLDFGTNTQPVSLVLADLDGDGKTDIATGNATMLPSVVTLLRNTGSPGSVSFAAKTDWTVILPATSLAAADFNNDAKQDIVFVSNAGASLVVLANSSTSGNFSFSPVITTSTGTFPDGVSVGDFDGDGKPDFAFANFYSNTVSVYRNTTTGSTISFQKIPDISLPGAQVVSVFDADGDGKPDLVVQTFSPGGFSILKNKSTTGTLAFAAPVAFASICSDGITGADLNGDGQTDVSLGCSLLQVGIWKNKTTGPQLTSFSPVLGGVGTEVTIKGANLAGVTAVTFGGLPAAGFSVVDSNTVTAIVANGASGAIGVAAPGDADTIDGFAFYHAPTISSFNPTTAITGSTVTITGTNFFGVTAVSFGGVPAASFTVIDSTKISARIGAGASGEVVVQAIGGIARRSGFTYIPPPHIVSFSPTTGTVGTVVTINGSNFGSATNVTFGGIPADTFSVVSPNLIQATVLGGSSGNVIVVTAGGTDTVSGFVFVSPPAPVVSSFSPTTGIPGTVVTINGNNFSTTPAQNVVYFGAVRANVISATATVLTVLVPAGAMSQPISVTTNFLTAYSSAAYIVTFEGGGNILPSTFGKAKGVETGLVPMDVTVGDFDGDGKIDIATANSSWMSTIAVLRNTGVGTIAFAPARNLDARDPKNIVSLDADGDGKKDLLVLNNNGASVSVYRNTSMPGVLGFDDRRDYPVVGVPSSFATGDLDGDGKIDVIVGQGASIGVLKNTSVVKNISFEPVLTLAEGYSGIVAVGDVDNDGKPDIAVLGRESIYILLNTSNGANLSFGPPVAYALRIDFPYYYGPTDLLFMDADGDGKQDIAVANTQKSESVSLFRNTSVPGTVSFEERKDFMTPGVYPFRLAAEDMDGDGKLDILVSHEYVPRRVSVLKNTGTGAVVSFAPNVNFTENVNGALTGIRAGDIDGDGKPEIIAAGDNTLPANIVYVFPNRIVWPHIDSFNPKNSVEDSVITITGVNFSGATSVSIGGCPARSFTVVSPTSIQAIVGRAADGNVTVTTPLGTDTATGFVYGLLPVVTSFAPATAPAGTLVTIKGANFTGATDVLFGVLRSLDVTVINDSTIVARVGNYGESGKVSVTTRIGTGSLSGFTFIPPPPVITSFSPAKGAEGLYVDIRGDNLMWQQGVTFGGVSATRVIVWSNNYIQAVVGKGASGYVRVHSEGGADSLAGFVFVPPPFVGGFTPESGRTGDTIRITGSDFRNVTSVSFGGTPARSFTIASDSLILAIVGTGTSGIVRLSAYSGTGSKDGFVYIPPSPTLVSFSPTSGRKGETIQLTGTNFNGVTSVHIGGTPVQSFTVTSPTIINAVIGEGTSGSVSVVQPSGTASLDGFTYIPPGPLIESFSPSVGKTGDTIVIKGRYFNGATYVAFGGLAAQAFTIDSATTITAIVGNGYSGSVSVSTPGGTAFQPGFTYNVATAVGSVTEVNAPGLVLSPNPGRGIVVIQHPVSYRHATICFVDVIGRTVLQIATVPNKKQTNVNVYSLPAGVYQVEWTDGVRRLARSFAVER